MGRGIEIPEPIKRIIVERERRLGESKDGGEVVDLADEDVKDGIIANYIDEAQSNPKTPLPDGITKLDVQEFLNNYRDQ